ncbi:ankyrin repeat domain-containing protein [Fluviicola chungangensis]|uniref:Uncharacterized protein n=1 Tax=Fluviicola chungangensis TaxID=2597671 RepID=A0A556N7I8_9FLAO|nr:ankyrin repeat domain-containing protein [Fluviicola chungangensis]TSJ47989.1 hypothetical protein FO442_02325 [Fluviicola chungangensis]
MKTKITLHKSVSKGDLTTVKELIEQGSDVNVPDKNNCTPVYLAFCENNEEMIDYLVSQGADIYYPSKNFPDCYYNALTNGKVDWIRKFIENGIDPNARRLDNYNALIIMLSSQNYVLDAHRLLLEAGCDPEMKSKHGHTALDYLAGLGIPELDELYSKYSKNVVMNVQTEDIRDNYGPSILFETTEKGNAKALRTLLEQNPDMELNKCDKGGNTALGIAILKKKKESAIVLLENGADPTIPPLDYDQNTLALDLAQEWVKRGIPKFQEVVDLIKTIRNKD